LERREFDYTNKPVGQRCDSGNFLSDATRIVNTARRASYQQLYRIEYSLHQLVEMQKKQAITLSKEDIAAYLGISVRSLNRSLKQLKEEGFCKRVRR